jgi:putative transposase
MTWDKATGKRKPVRVPARLEVPLPDGFDPGQVRQLRIGNEGRLFDAVFTVERPVPSRRPVGRVITIDPNQSNMGYGVGTDGVATDIRNSEFLQILDRRIDEVQSLQDRCQRKSGRVVGRRDGGVVAVLAMAEAERAVGGTLPGAPRADKGDLRTVANHLYWEYDAVCVGDYAPQGGGMRRAMNNQSLIGQCNETLAWVATRSGKVYGE